MEDTALFDQVLDGDEQVLLCQKPSPSRFYLNFWGKTLLWTLWVFLLTELVLLVFENVPVGYYFIPFALFGVALVFAIPLSILCFDHTVYAVTNKRILVRTGITGIEFRSLNLISIGVVNFKQDIWDRMLLHNTGSIFFGGQLETNGQTTMHGFEFKFIEKPQAVYTAVRKLLNNKKEDECKQIK